MLNNYLYQLPDFVNFIESSNSLVLFAVILGLCLILSYLISDPGGKQKKFVKRLECIPGPRKFPIVGNALQMIFPPEEILTWLEKVNRDWGEIARFWVFGSPKVFINSYDIAMQLLQRKNFLAKSEEFKPLEPIGKNSLVGAPPHLAPIKRKLLSPGFSRQTVEESIGIYSKHIYKLRNRLDEFADSGRGFNVMERTCYCAYSIGCETAFGPEIMHKLTESDLQEQIHSWHVLLVNLVHRSMQPWLKSDVIYNLTPKGKQNQKCFKRINGFAENAIKQKRAQRQYLKSQINLQCEKKPGFQIEGQSLSSKYTFFLDLLLDLEDRKEQTALDVLHETNIFIVAGYDTTGTTAAWLLHFLSSNPHSQNKVVEELREIFPEGLTSSVEITLSDIKRMKYLDCCIKEALRICPVLPWMLRRSDEDIVLSDGRVIPAGVDIPINTYIIHRDPDVFPEPEVFRPERHSAAFSTQGFPKSRLLTFGAGPRNCPGMFYAMTELKIMMAHLLLTYSWESLDDPKKIKRVFHGVLSPDKGINVKIKRRSN